jgi:transposase
MSQRFRTCDLDQVYLLPPSLQDWLPENHLARFIAEVVSELDLTALYAAYERKDGRGQLGYHPELLLRVLFYAYAKGVTSSRKIELAIAEDVGFRYLAANQLPDHDTIASFRQRHLSPIGDLFLQVLHLCQKAGLMKLGNVSIDGTKLLANASANRSVKYPRLDEREQYWKGEVSRMLTEAQKTDEQEDALHGKGKSDASLPEELANAKQRLERIRQAKQELNEEARKQQEKVEAEAKEMAKSKPNKQSSAEQRAEYRQRRERLKKRRQRAQANVEQPVRAYNFVDPDSRIMRDNGHKRYVQGYNAQAAVDGHAQIIVAAEITQEVTDRNQLLPMADQVRQNLAAVAAMATDDNKVAMPQVITADAGYWDTTDLLDERLRGIEVLVAPDSGGAKTDEGQRAANAPSSGIAQEMRNKLNSESGRALYGQRKTVVEPVFGQIKQARGIRRLWLRGLDKVAGEWKLICAAHNLLKLFRHYLELPSPSPAGV